MAKITLNHLVYQVLEFASSGTLPTDLNVSWELAAQWVAEQRAILIGQSLNKKDQINDSWIQYIPCVKLEQVMDNNCCSEASDCYILKSKQKLPSTIDTYLDNWLVSVNTEGGVNISKTNPIKQRYSKYNKYTSTSRGWYIKDDYLYVINDQNLELVNVSGLFEYPEDVARFIDCSGQPCFTEDSDYPVSLTLASQIVDIINKTKLQPFMTAPADTSNNAQGETPKQISDSKQAGK